jgi:predicted enzyme related to lactoylglutathione lyase
MFHACLRAFRLSRGTGLVSSQAATHRADSLYNRFILPSKREPSMKNRGHLYFEIQADDSARAIRFYSAVFGWEFTEVKGLPIPYWSIETGGSRGGLLQSPAAKPPMRSATNAFVCSVEVENFDATAAKITSGGGTIALGKFAVPGTCWQGYFIDLDGNTFGIFQVDPNAGR